MLPILTPHAGALLQPLFADPQLTRSCRSISSASCSSYGSDTSRMGSFQVNSRHQLTIRTSPLSAEQTPYLPTYL
jgi:hypothetical protein